jgi:hypothetical protein
VVGTGERGGVSREVVEGNALEEVDGLKVKAGSAVAEGRWRRDDAILAEDVEECWLERGR